jgi:hypothetical protein
MTIRGQMIATRRRLRRLRGRTIATWTVLSVVGCYLLVGPAWTVVAEVFALWFVPRTLQAMRASGRLAWLAETPRPSPRAIPSRYLAADDLRMPMEAVIAAAERDAA